ncbi:DMT family transporter [Clostridium sp. PL3]|uniref:DMT family transporter n=1 Tax=Clostridium thailandense TaxID=2794346 RepID=A0A949U3V4_9CLOT|nr:DMT family transporter [Clostridium thailandense]MBV7276901.1 DMT family transporter [Clostridium thailandense]
MSKHNKTVLLATFSLAFVAIFWGTSYAIVKDSLNDIKPFQLMTLRFGLSTIILSLIFWKKLKKINKRDLCQGSIIGVFLFLAFLTLVIGILYTTASKQSFLVGAYIIIVPFLAWGINKRVPNRYEIIGALISIVGIGLLTLDGSLYINKGDVISIFCSISFACHMIAIEYFSKDSDPIISTIVQFAIGSILFVMLTGIFESYKINFTPKMIKSTAYLVIVTTVIPFLVQNIAQKYISSTSTALIFTLESAFGGIFALFFLNETMTCKMIAGSIVIFLGIITEETKLSFLKKLKRTKSDVVSDTHVM